MGRGQNGRVEDAKEFLDLKLDHLFAIGGNRCVFEHPLDPALCVKVNRKDRSPEFKWRKAVWWKRLRALDSFDENLEEERVLSTLQSRAPQLSGRLFPSCHGQVRTPYGDGLVLTLFRDQDGGISSSLERAVLENTPGVDEAVDCFAKRWIDAAIPSRQLLLHNLVLRKGCKAQELCIVDGLGSGHLLDFGQFSEEMGRKRASRLVTKLRERILAIESRRNDWSPSMKDRLQPLSEEFRRRALGLPS